MTTCDRIVLGAGHNPLIFYVYCARAGLDVLCLERRAVTGGASPPRRTRAIRVSCTTHAFLHRALTDMPWYRDLELARDGARYIEPELNVALILPDARSLRWWTDFALGRVFRTIQPAGRGDTAPLAR